jgi:hypothetical protein
MKMKLRRKETWSGFVRLRHGFRLYRFGWMLQVTWGRC